MRPNNDRFMVPPRPVKATVRRRTAPRTSALSLSLSLPPSAGAAGAEYQHP